jgi:hypothetical protein
MTQCLERGTPERDDASKPREKIVIHHCLLEWEASLRTWEMPSKNQTPKGYLFN